MPNAVPLDREKHAKTRIDTSRGAEFGENIHLVPVIANELRSLILDYPVCLIKDDNTGRFGMHALLGFEAGENLFLSGNCWDASYVPLHIRRQPFLVAVTEGKGSDPKLDNVLISIDMDSNRVQEADGEALFSEDGNWTPYLRGIGDILSILVPGIKATEALIAALVEHDLIESAQLNVSFASGEEKQFDGLYTVNDEKLAEISGETLKEFQTRGYLQASYLLNASIGHVRKLIERKNALLSPAS